MAEDTVQQKMDRLLPADLGFLTGNLSSDRAAHQWYVGA